MNPTDLVDRTTLRDDVPEFAPGDTVKVHVRVVEGNRERIQVFQGAVIRRQGSGARETFTARKVSFGVGVERTFPVHSPIVAKIEVLTHGDVRRATGEAVLPAGAGRQSSQDSREAHRSLIGWRPAVATAYEPPGLPPFAMEEAPPSRGQLAKEIPLLIGLAVLIAFLVKTFVAQAFYIPSGSMIPQLNIGDRVVVSKVSYDLHDPNRRELLVFDAPPRAPGVSNKSKGTGAGRVVRDIFESIGILQPSTEEYIKRVFGLPGETVQGKDGHVVINGRERSEPCLPPGTPTSDFGPLT